MASERCELCGEALDLPVKGRPDVLCKHCRRLRRLKRVLGVVAFVLVATAAAAPFLYRHAQLVGLPDIGDPFDAGKFGTVIAGDDANAMLYYQAAVPPEQPDSDAVDSEGHAVDELQRAFDKGWTHATPGIRAWLDSSRPALTLMKQGAKLDEAWTVQPKEQSYETFVSIGQHWPLSKLARLEAERLRSTGSPAEAWEWLRVAFRHSRHIGMHGAAIDRLMAASFHAEVSKSIPPWAADSAVDSELLRTALANIVEDYGLTKPVSTNLRSEYFLQMDTLERYPPASSFDPFKDECQPLLSFFRNEPEVGKRVIRLTYENWLSQCDLPKHMQSPQRIVPPYLFEARIAGEDRESVPVTEIERFCARSPVAMRAVGRGVPLGQGILREQTRQKQLEVVLSVQLFFREHGRLPDTPEQILNEYLSEWPSDPFAADQTPMGYRHEAASATAVVWSVGPDGTDSGGHVIDRWNDPEFDLGMKILTPDD